MTLPAYRADDRAVTHEAFYAIACDPQRSVVVEACAGAGKTWMLVSRILRALLDGAQPHEILAITFTRKAAGEMRERLQDWLREFAAPGYSDEQRIHALTERGISSTRAAEMAAALEGLHSRVLDGGRPVEIRTFHAWFGQLLRAAPLDLLSELGLQPELELIEDLDDHRGEVQRRFHAALLRDAALQADHATLIAERGRSQVRSWLDSALSRRIEIELADNAGVLDASVVAASVRWPHLASLDHPAQQLQAGSWPASLRDLAKALGQGGKPAQAAGGALASALELTDTNASFDGVWRALFTDKGGARKLGPIDALDSVQAGLEDVATQIRQHEAHLEHARMVRLSRVLLAEYAAYKRQRGLADMADLERCGLALLRDATLAGWVQERLDARIRHVLIDEFQDTSPLQWHALHAWLSAYAGAGGGASGQRPPGVFIVGDPKQSIYRFRRAEPRVFEAARAFVVDALGGSVLECDHTRRNAPELLAALNPVFGRACAAGAFDGFRDHTTQAEPATDGGLTSLPLVLRPPRKRASETAAEAPNWRDTLTTARHEPDEILREQEAVLVAQAIRAQLDEGQFKPADVMVLCRKRESLRLVAQALRGVHVPYAAAEETALVDAPEALDLIALLDALVSPQHRLSLARALRSPLFGASDADLIELAQRAGPSGDWWQALCDLAHDRPVLARAGALLPRWREAAGRLPPHDLLDRIVHEGGLRERLVASLPPERRIAALDTVDAVLAQALVLDGARYATPYGFVRALKRRAIKVGVPSHPDAVQLHTVHGAKGLEADLVFVMDADPEARNASTATLLVDWAVDAEHPRACAFIYSESSCPASLIPLLEAERAARQREELNGLYVAMTRARRRLVFSATQPFRTTGDAPSWWERVQPVAVPWVGQAPSAAASTAAGPATVSIIALPLLAEPPADRPPVSVAADTPANRLGQAVHRVLEWATSGSTVSTRVDSLALAAAAEFGAPPVEVERLARVILASPECARFFNDPALAWTGNEVSVSEGGEALRVDRLVRLDERGAPVWWVLDYKLHHRPQDLPAYRAQMLRYCAAVRRVQPGETVRGAFITAEGSVIEVV